MYIDQLITTDLDRKILTPIISVLRIRKYQAIFVISSIIYPLSYMFILGIISYYPGLVSITDSYPMVRVTTYGISILPFPNIFIFVFYGTIAFIITSSFLVALNISLMFYSRGLGRPCRIRDIKLKGMFGIIPAFFTSFACCGGGLMVLVIGSAAFSSLALYSKYMAPVTIAALAIGTFLMLRHISRTNKLNNTSICCTKEEG